MSECCSNLPDLDFTPCCSYINWHTWNTKRIRMYAKTNDCYDEDGNYLGVGRFDGETLIIEKEWHQEK